MTMVIRYQVRLVFQYHLAVLDKNIFSRLTLSTKHPILRSNITINCTNHIAKNHKSGSYTSYLYLTQIVMTKFYISSKKKRKFNHFSCPSLNKAKVGGKQRMYKYTKVSCIQVALKADLVENKLDGLSVPWFFSTGFP